MTRWEYKVVHWLSVNEKQLTVWLDELGQEGWELVSEAYYGGGNGTRYTFKRPAEGARQGGGST
jgi:hypothetical protein